MNRKMKIDIKDLLMGIVGIVAVMFPTFSISPIPQIIVLMSGSYLIYKNLKIAILITIVGMILMTLGGVVITDISMATHMDLTLLSIINGFVGGFIGALFGKFI
jgi:hypothetical protein